MKEFFNPHSRNLVFRTLHVAIAMRTGYTIQKHLCVVKSCKQLSSLNSSSDLDWQRGRPVTTLDHYPVAFMKLELFRVERSYFENVSRS